MKPVIEWTDLGVVMLDQRRLPQEEVYVTCRDERETAEAIRAMVIRGAPAIGIAAAMGVALGLARAREGATADAWASSTYRAGVFDAIAATLLAARPTAVNLAWAVARQRRVFDRATADPERVVTTAIEEGQRLDAEDVAINRRIGQAGQELLTDGTTVLTHCNAGALATGGYGTALGVIRAATAAGKRIAVLADETRPYLQGARLTVWELQRDQIPVTLQCDAMAGLAMARGMVQAVIVGADRIAANGDTANKIGTYPLAILARHHRIPFYVAAPRSTIDPQMADGRSIPIEERPAREVTHFRGTPVAPVGTRAFNPAFDVTPGELITAIVTEAGIARPPYARELPAHFPAE